MGRMQIGGVESPVEGVQRGVPEPFNGSDFRSLRWLKGVQNIVGPKNVLDLLAIKASQVPVPMLKNVHRVIDEVCPAAGWNWHHGNSLLEVYHYLGTKEQFFFRDDPRHKIAHGGNRTANYIKNKDADGTNKLGSADQLRPWLEGFVGYVGAQEAARLLEGVGRIGVE
jgi:hypothetical protein